jgi:hypothetical protein
MKRAQDYAESVKPTQAKLLKEIVKAISDLAPHLTNVNDAEKILDIIYGTPPEDEDTPPEDEETPSINDLAYLSSDIEQMNRIKAQLTQLQLQNQEILNKINELYQEAADCEKSEPPEELEPYCEEVTPQKGEIHRWMCYNNGLPEDPNAIKVLGSWGPTSIWYIPESSTIPMQ